MLPAKKLRKDKDALLKLRNAIRRMAGKRTRDDESLKKLAVIKIVDSNDGCQALGDAYFALFALWMRTF